VYPVPDPLLLRKSVSAGDRTRDIWVSRPLDHGRSIPPIYALIFKVQKISFRSLNVAFSFEELLLNPYPLVDNIALFITCLEISVKEVSSDMGL
jgi:hypothetical protein